MSYDAALEMCGLERLSERREKKMLSFSKKCINNEFTESMFPYNDPGKREPFYVNFARTEQYKKKCYPSMSKSPKCILHGT